MSLSEKFPWNSHRVIYILCMCVFRVRKATCSLVSAALCSHLPRDRSEYNLTKCRHFSLKLPQENGKDLVRPRSFRYTNLFLKPPSIEWEISPDKSNGFPNTIFLWEISNNIPSSRCYCPSQTMDVHLFSPIFICIYKSMQIAELGQTNFTVNITQFVETLNIQVENLLENETNFS